MINHDPTPTPEQILHQTSLARGWHRITIDGKTIQVTASDLEAVLEAAYDHAKPAWLDRIDCSRRDDADYLCVDGQPICQGFIL